MDEQIEKHARDAAEELFAQRAAQLNAGEQACYERVDTARIEVSQPRSLKAEYVHHELWKELKAAEAL